MHCYETSQHGVTVEQHRTGCVRSCKVGRLCGSKVSAAWQHESSYFEMLVLLVLCHTDVAQHRCSPSTGPPWAHHAQVEGHFHKVFADKHAERPHERSLTTLENLSWNAVQRDANPIQRNRVRGGGLAKEERIRVGVQTSLTYRTMTLCVGC